MFLTLSILLFSLVALELSATIKKSTEEGQNAFLISRIQSSEPQILSEKLRQLLITRASKSIYTLLAEAGVMSGIGLNLEDLRSLEVSLAQDFKHRYDLLTYYLPDDLKRFFESSRILWDVESLKLLACHVLSRENSEEPMQIAGPFGYLDLKSIESLAKSKSLEELITNSISVLPDEFSLKATPEKYSGMNDFEFFLDLAAFEYLRKMSKERATRETRLAWNLMVGFYEVQNVLTIARLKQSRVPPEEISHFLFPSRRMLDEREISRLLEAEDYTTFLQTLRGTRYGKHIPGGMIDIAMLQGLLRKTSLGSGLEELQPEMAMIIQFFMELDTQYETIRKAASLVSLKAYDEE